MKKIETKISDLFILEPKVFGDERGYFFESYNEKAFKELGFTYNFVQDNESFSSYGTLRGLHFQKGEFAQAKLVRVVKGVVLDVAVDIRKESPTFGQHVAVELSEQNKRMLMIPRGFAHGFVVLSDTAVFQYKCDNFYSPENEGGIAWDDIDLGINWKVERENIIISEKDKRHFFLKKVF